MKAQINFTHLNKLLTCQPYLVWHNIEKEVDTLSDEYKNFEFDLPAFIDSYEHSLTEIQAKSASIIKTKFLQKMYKKFKNLKIVPEEKLKNRAILTKQYLNNFQNNVIYNPTFIYKYQNYEVVANPMVYDQISQTVYFLKMSTNTKRGDIIKLFFDIEVMKKLDIKIKHVYLYIIATNQYKKGEIDFFATKYLNSQKTGPTYKDKADVNYYANVQMLKAGLSNDKSWDILKIINEKKVDRNFIFDDLDNYLQQIIDAANYDELNPLSTEDYQFLNECYVPWKTIVNLKNDVIYRGYNGKLIKKQDIIDEVPLAKLLKERPLLQKIIKNPGKVIINVEKVKKIINKIRNHFVVWYDFEAFALPIAPMDNFLPFSQVVSQVSVIKTKQMVEKSIVNLVIDPQVINYDDFATIVNTIYDSQADCYVVYNASYEHSRLNDIVQKMYETSYKGVNEVEFKVKEIIKKTIDLANLFIVNSANKIPPILITDLKGMYSIKRLEKYITTKYTHFPYKIKRYDSLAISNGLYAMEVINNRALDIIGDNEWKRKSHQLAEYCENDVRAMIMVYYLVEKLLHEQITLKE